MKRVVFNVLTALLALCIFAPPVFAGTSFKFAVIADPHTSVAGPNSPANASKMFKESESLLQSAIDAINQRKDIDFVVALGDLTKDAEPWNVDRFKELMDGLDAPYYVVLGNHDISPVDTNKTDLSPGVTRANMIWAFQGHGYEGPETHWSTDPLPGVHLVGLDSSRTGDWDGRITKSGLKFLERDLSANPDKLTIVILHHQLAAYSKSAMSGENDFDKFVLRNAEEVLEILRNHPQVVMTLSGHRHISSRYIKDKHLNIFTCPSTMTWPMRYMVCEIDNNKISYNTYDVNADPRVWAEAKQNMMDDKWWHPENEHPLTEEGNKKFISFMLSEETKSDVIDLSSSTKAAID